MAIRHASVFVLALLLCACGGGEDNSTKPDDPEVACKKVIEEVRAEMVKEIEDNTEKWIADVRVNRKASATDAIELDTMRLTEGGVTYTMSKEDRDAWVEKKVEEAVEGLKHAIKEHVASLNGKAERQYLSFCVIYDKNKDASHEEMKKLFRESFDEMTKETLATLNRRK